MSWAFFHYSVHSSTDRQRDGQTDKQTAALTDTGSMNVTKSTVTYPTIPRARHSSATLLTATLSTAGSTDDWGTDRPQHENSDSAWIWSPLTISSAPLSAPGSTNMDTLNAVTLSDGGHASSTPPAFSMSLHTECRRTECVQSTNKFISSTNNISYYKNKLLRKELILIFQELE